ncbi:MAG TPA: hypothetical protein VGQ53_14345 [Chitinophagaceae bacterium]|nr:hypothetical protein [Chitinophagaceae bacterium]
MTRKTRSLLKCPLRALKDYMLAFYTIVIENLNRQQLSKKDWQRTVSISDRNISPKLRRLSKEEINILIENGKTAVKNYLN